MKFCRPEEVVLLLLLLSPPPPLPSLLLCAGVHLGAMKHGRGIGGAAPASDAAGRARDATARASSRVRPRHATWRVPFFSRLAPTRLRLGPILTESGRLGPYRQISAETAETADSGQNYRYGRNLLKNKK